MRKWALIASAVGLLCIDVSLVFALMDWPDVTLFDWVVHGYHLIVFIGGGAFLWTRPDIIFKQRMAGYLSSLTPDGQQMYDFCITALRSPYKRAALDKSLAGKDVS